jgi:hypothetical protein
MYYVLIFPELGITNSMDLSASREVALQSFMLSEISLPRSQRLFTDHHFEPDKSNPYQVIVTV